MGREIQYWDRPVAIKKAEIAAMINHYVSCRCIEEGGSGLISPIVWHDDMIFDNYQQAQDYIEKIDDGNYRQIAVKYRVTKPIKNLPKSIQNLQSRLESEICKRKAYINEHSIHNKKCDYIGCPTCGSKLKKDLIRGECCPLCRTDLRSESTLSKIRSFDADIHDLRNRISKETDTYTSKINAKNKDAEVRWLIKFEFHQ